MKLYKFEKNDQNQFTEPVQMDGPLILSDSNVLGIHAADKKYVDNKLSTGLNANNISGVLPVSRMIAFSGDAKNTAGNNTFSLNNIITAGDYVKVTTNDKGLVVNGGVLTANDVNPIPWTKLTGLPTSLAGYGITDGIRLNGETVTTKLEYKGPTTNNLNPVTKGYLENKISNLSATSLVGSLFETAIEDTPAGYLRANGGRVDKTAYANLYAIIGDRFSWKMLPGSGKPWRQQYLFNTTDPGNLTWSNANNDLPVPLVHSQAIVTKNRVYLLGGHSASNWISTVHTAPINEDGTLGTWTTGTSLPGVLSDYQAVVTKNRVYLLGGLGYSYISVVYTAPINEDGTLGTWATETPSLEASLWSQAVVIKNRVYILGGASRITVYTAPINEDGTLGTWTTGTSLPSNLGFSQAVVTKNRVYLLGGHNSSTSTSTVYTAPINEDGTLGTWTTGTSLPSNLVSSQAVVTKNRVYLLGGYNYYSAIYVSTVYTAPINEDGTIGTWTTGTNLPGPLGASQAVVTKNRVYLLGGYSGYSSTSTVYTAPFTGGRNDYSEFYTGNLFTTIDPTKFTLPDLSQEETANTKFYVCYE